MFRSQFFVFRRQGNSVLQQYSYSQIILGTLQGPQCCGLSRLSITKVLQGSRKGNIIILGSDDGLVSSINSSDSRVKSSLGLIYCNPSSSQSFIDRNRW